MLVFLLCLCAAAAVLLIYHDGQASFDAPALTIAPQALDLGTVWQQPALPFRLPIHNSSNQTVRVEQLTATCSCTQLHPQQFDVPPGESVEVQGVVDLSHSLKSPRHAEGRLEVQLIPRTLQGDGKPSSAATHDDVVWLLHGTVRRAVYLDPGTLHFEGPYAIVRGAEPPTMMVSGRMDGPAAALDPPPESPVAAVRVIGPTDERTFELAVTPRSPLPMGLLDSTVTLHTRLSDGSAGPNVVLPVKGSIVPPVRLVPNRLTLRPGTGSDLDRSVPDEEDRSSAEVSQVNLIGRDGQEWFLVEAQELPAWLSIGGSEADQPTGTVNLQADGDVPTGTNADLTLVAESIAGQRAELKLTVSVSRPGTIHRHPTESNSQARDTANGPKW